MLYLLANLPPTAVTCCHFRLRCDCNCHIPPLLLGCGSCMILPLSSLGTAQTTTATIPAPATAPMVTTPTVTFDSLLSQQQQQSSPPQPFLLPLPTQLWSHSQLVLGPPCWRTMRCLTLTVAQAVTSSTPSCCRDSAGYWARRLEFLSIPTLLMDMCLLWVQP